ncbi:MAG: hypothetical protein KKB50_21800 [Planctomycetes bacterium]|nr:hypothetical protein [Planctomycetota bacterium]
MPHPFQGRGTDSTTGCHWWLAHQRVCGARYRLSAVLLLFVLLCSPASLTLAQEPAEEATKLLRSDSRAPYVHRITLYDHDGTAISPEDEPAQPYSPRATCAKCHEYALISHGWHFNADKPQIAPGRLGEPWLLVERATGTVLPLSGRKWPGTFTPAELGLTNWQFVKQFGGHTPGGGFGEPSQEVIDAAPEALRWGISGALEIDCMFCHSADYQHDPAEAARQIERENLKWAPTAALGLAVIRGEARKMPDDWDPFVPPDPDRPEQQPPTVDYDKQRFDADERVYFNITRRPAAERCYFCHSVREVELGEDGTATQLADRWRRGRDVHLAAGMTCADCHRNDVAHMIVRGYVEHSPEPGEARAAVYSCSGCHLGTEDGAGAEALGGRYGAPHPQHRGLPPVHFEKLACTACHSGPWPEPSTRFVQTSLAHGLGIATKDRRADDWPQIVEPVFARQADGKIAPQRLVWPAYFGWLGGQGVRPVWGTALRSLVGDALPDATDRLKNEQIAAVLEAMAAAGANDGAAIYVQGGRLHQRTEAGKLTITAYPGQAEPHAVAEEGAYEASTRATAPYVWALAHDVRPATQALGVRGCSDCHGSGAPLNFGQIYPTGSYGDWGGGQTMLELRGDSAALAHAWALGFVFRPAFKVFGYVCAGLVILLLLRHLADGFRAERVPASAARPLDYVGHHLVLAGLGVQVLTAFILKWITGDFGDWLLLVHMGGAFLFVLGLALTALTWAPRCRFGPGAADGLNAGQKIMFWLALVLGVLVAGAMLAAMVPVFGYAGQELLLEVHEIGAIVLVIAMVVHTLVSVKARRAER